jgi:integrase
LRWEDVDFFGRTIRVRRTNWRGHEGPPKGKRARSIPMNSLVYDTLKAHRHLGELVFTNSVGKPLDINGGYKTFKTLCRLAGLRALRRHDIRHTFASNLAALTGNLLAVKEILGHVDYATTLRYAHLTPSQFADAVEALVTKSGGERAGAVDAQRRRG